MRNYAGASAALSNSVAIGNNAEEALLAAVYIGDGAGYTASGNYNVAIGKEALDTGVMLVRLMRSWVIGLI